MEKKDGVLCFYAKSRKEWRKWFEKNQTLEKSVWLIMFHKGSEKPSVYYEEAVEEALCFGWIDSKPNKRDEESYYLFFAKRKPSSKWSKANKERVERLINEGKLTPSGLALVELAKKSGTWDALEEIQNSVLPEDLQSLLEKNNTALTNFMAFPPSSKRIILEWIANAKRAETRSKRIEETIALAAKNIRANHYRQ